MQEIFEDTETMIRRIRNKIYEETKDMTIEEEMDYHQKGVEAFNHRAATIDKSKFDFDIWKKQIKAARSVETEQLVRWIRDEIYEETKDMTPEERREYVSKRSENLREQWNNSKPAKRDFAAP